MDLCLLLSNKIILFLILIHFQICLKIGLLKIACISGDR